MPSPTTEFVQKHQEKALREVWDSRADRRARGLVCFRPASQKARASEKDRETTPQKSNQRQNLLTRSAEISVAAQAVRRQEVAARAMWVARPGLTVEELVPQRPKTRFIMVS